MARGRMVSGLGMLVAALAGTACGAAGEPGRSSGDQRAAPVASIAPAASSTAPPASSAPAAAAGSGVPLDAPATATPVSSPPPTVARGTGTPQDKALAEGD